MKKRIPAKKGFAPFKENKTGKTDKPAGPRNRPFSDGERPGRASAKDQHNGEEKPSFRKRSFDKPARDEQPARKRSFSTGRNGDDAPVRKKFSDKKERFSDKKEGDNSSFHGDFSRKSTGQRENRDTPSGFNRKKFFDRVNDRFADKHERRRTPIKKKDANDHEYTKKPSEPKAAKESTFGPGEMPLNKYIAHCGLCSRRKAVDYIKEGKVTLNGKTVTEPATKVTAADTVTLQDKKITLQKNLVYILLNKPKGYITTTDDPEGRKTVMDLIEDAVEDKRIYPVGRLDRNTSGLLLLTNDGELAQKLAHPKHNIKKIYQVELDKPLTKNDAEKILAGVTLEDGVAHVDALGYVDPRDKKQVGIEIHSGKNRIVRRIFEHMEYNVEKLDRVMYAGLTKKTLNRGQWRFLTDKEVILLKHFK